MRGTFHLYPPIPMSFITPAIFESLRTLKDGSISFTLSTQEISPESAVRLMELRNKHVIAALSEKGFSEEAVNELENIKLDPPKKAKGEKSKAQRLRAVFYRIWESTPNNFETADQHYDYMMEKVIDFYKEKIED